MDLISWVYVCIRLRVQGKTEACEAVNGHGKVIEDFAHCVLSGRTPAAGAADSLAELRTALAIYKSAQTGKWENVWDAALENVHLPQGGVSGATVARL